MPARKKAKVEQQDNAIENAAPAQEVDITVENQEDPVRDAQDRTPESEKEQPADSSIKNAAEANEVDETVENQMNPGTSEKDRSEDLKAEEENPYAEMAPAMKVDETVENQMNPGINMVDRNPGPQIVEDSAGITYDVSKSTPELVDPNSEEREQELARIRQQSGVLNAADWREENKDKTTIEFVETGLTGLGHVWKKGERYTELPDAMPEWTKLSAKEQEERYGKVFYKEI